MFVTDQLIITVCYGAHSAYLPNAIVLGTAFQFSEKQTVTVRPFRSSKQRQYLCFLELALVSDCCQICRLPHIRFSAFAGFTGHFAFGRVQTVERKVHLRL